MGLEFVKNSQTSFRRHLTTVVTVGVLALSITASLLTAWVTSKNLYDVLVEDGLQVAASLSDQSVLALLYGSGENAEDAVRVAMAFPSVSQVMIISLEGDAILSEGGRAFSVAAWEWPSHDAVVIYEDVDQWVFMAPVYTGSSAAPEDDILLLNQESSEELIGYVVVSKDKTKLREIQVLTVFNNLIIGLLFAMVLVYILQQRFKRLTEPLYELSEVMHEAQREDSDRHPYAKLSGPKEVVQIALSYNKMMEVLAERDQQLREHNEHLESEVALRTQELVYARDIAVEANQNKSQFLANVTHELRTPLQAIIGFSDLISETLSEDEEDTRRDVESILVNAQNLLTLINGILDLSKVESGRMDLNLQPENLESLLNQVVDTVKPLIDKHHNKLLVEAEYPSHDVTLDGVKIRQVLLNLLSNSAKFTENGTIALSLTCEQQTLKIVVSDTGIGISKEHQAIIFDAFRQVDGTHTRKYQGTGLGLAISRKFCEIMGGNIELESQLGEGCVFTVTIPLLNSKK